MSYRNEREIPTGRIAGVHFAPFTTAEVKALSVKEITNPATFDALQNPSLHGLYDPALGPVNQHEVCTTCRQLALHCPGHVGHISLPLPVYYPFFYPLLNRLLNVACLCCDRLLVADEQRREIVARLRRLDAGLLDENFDGDESKNSDVDNHVTTNTDVTGHVIKSTAEQSKNIAEVRLGIVKDFFKLTRKSLKGTCRRCGAPFRKLKKDGWKLFLKPLIASEARQWANARRSSTKNERDDDDDDDDDDVDDAVSSSVSFRDEYDIAMSTVYLSPLQVRKHVRGLFESDGDLLSFLVGGGGGGGDGAQFFLDVLLVPPPKFRPSSFSRDMRIDNPQTANLAYVLKTTGELREVLRNENREESVDDDSAKKGDPKADKVYRLWMTLQADVVCFMDSEMMGKTVSDRGIGVRQTLEKKEGLFRKNMMGKRVNFAARSVISPDPYLKVDEVGIPMVFAKKLTYPQGVMDHNVDELRQAIINGPDNYPGATMIEMEDGSLVRLNAKFANKRASLAKRLLAPPLTWNPSHLRKKVHRHLKNGDMLLLNRQPTLHRPSIMGHRARVLPGEKTIRLHYSNCKSYNADFDGDEMNVHFPQNELGRAEVKEIASSNYQYLVPKDGRPLGGLIQDHIVSAVLMMIRGRFFSREEYQQLVFTALPDCSRRIPVLKPCILKPRRLWSGKQVASTVLIALIPDSTNRINMNGKTKIPQNAQGWAVGMCDDSMSEGEVIVRQGEILSGVLDKAQLGPSQFGLVHCCYELYGGQMAGGLLSAYAKLFTSFLHYRGFTLGVEDILVQSAGNDKRTQFMKDALKSGPRAIANAFALPDDCDDDAIRDQFRKAHRADDAQLMKTLEYAVKTKVDKITNEINKAIVPNGLIKSFPHNALQLMIQAGAKGSMVNSMQISCLLGQIELEGRRPPLMASGRSLPSFRPYDPSPRAGGFVDGRFLTGIRPQEYFFHCMAGREGLVDTAVKTSRSGYLQRCLIKHLEALKVGYDLTVRDGDGSVVQFLYGEDGLDVGKTRCLKPEQFSFMVQNYDAFLPQCKAEAILEATDIRKAPLRQSKVWKWIRRRGSAVKRSRSTSSFLNYSTKHLPEFARMLNDDKDGDDEDDCNVMGRSASELAMIKSWYRLIGPAREQYERNTIPCPDPSLSVYRPDRYFGSVSEKLAANVDDYVTRNPDGLLCSANDEEEEAEDDDDSGGPLLYHKFESIMQLKYMRSLAEPGESVGILASQSIGEPSTQMTLNTFHFAGRGEMNVTLGIPRLREILMVASASIKTPSMEVPFRCGEVSDEEKRRMVGQLNFVALSQVLKKIEVWESTVQEARTPRCRQYRILLTFKNDHDLIESSITVSLERILASAEHSVVDRIVRGVEKHIKMENKRRLSAFEESGDSKRLKDDDENPKSDEKDDDDDDDDDSDVDVGDDAGATETKRRQQSRQLASYDAPDEEDEVEDQGDEKSDVSDDDSTESNDGSSIKRDGVRRQDNDSSSDEDESELVPAPKQKKKQATRKEPRAGRCIVAVECDVKKATCEMTLVFPLRGSKVMMVAFIRKLAERAVVYEVPGIKRCFVREANDKQVLTTEGVNIHEIWRYADILDMNRLYSNDIHAVAKTYGIEAARRTLIKEVESVFKVYGIDVDPRHLSLIADYMTFSGAYRAFNRLGMETNTSPFQKMSFETSIQFLKSVVLAGEVDGIESPSSALVCGRIVPVGTGCCELRHLLTV